MVFDTKVVTISAKDIKLLGPLVNDTCSVENYIINSMQVIKDDETYYALLVVQQG